MRALRIAGSFFPPVLRQRWLWLIVVPLLLLARLPSLLAVGANNLAAMALLPEWESVSQEVGFPRCEPRLEPSAAEPYLAQALKWDPDNQRALVNLGRVAWLNGDCSIAQTSWEQALQVAPGDEIAAFWLFWMAGAKTQKLPGTLTAERMAEYAYYRSRRAGPGAAQLAWLQLSLDLNPARDAAHRLAKLHQQGGRPQEAVSTWQRLAAALPEDHPDHWWALGQAAELESDWARAAWAYRQGVEVAEDAYLLWMQQAATLERLDRWDDAEGAYRQAVVARPELAEPYLKLGHLRARQGDYEGALAWYTEAQAVDPRHAGSNYYLAQTLYHLGGTEQAEIYLEQAVKQDAAKKHWEWVAQLGDWRLALGDREGALAAYRQAQTWKPGEAEIQERIEKALEETTR